jgi:ubiquinone/menaquinone biosynthesis C-methylase UbiE
MSSTTPPAPARSAKEQFDKQAAHYNSQWNQWSEQVLEWMVAHAEIQPTDRVLDIGTGTGFTALAFAEKAANVVGTDVSSGMLEQGRQRAEKLGLTNVTFAEAPAESQPFEDENFDIVTCRIAAPHFLDVRQFVAEAARVLKPDGRLIMSDTTVPDDQPDIAAWQNKVEVERDLSHVRNYSPREWQVMVEDAGLTVQEITSGGGGITIPLSDWLFKAGCNAEQERTVRRLFAEATLAVRAAFQIQGEPGAEDRFTWQRVLLKAVK